MLQYRILHIPTGEWVVKITKMRANIYETRFKWLAERFLKRMIVTNSVTFIRVRDTYEQYTEEEFCVVAVNKRIEFTTNSKVSQPPMMGPPITRKAVVK